MSVLCGKTDLYLVLIKSTHKMAHAIQELQLDDYQRYGRQMILDGFGLPGSFLFYLVFYLRLDNQII